MAYKCRICGTNDVEHVGDVCELCAIGQDPYAAAMQNNNVKELLKRYSLARIPFIAVNTIEPARTLDMLKEISEELQLQFNVHTLTKGVYDLSTDKNLSDDKSVYGAIDYMTEQMKRKQYQTIILTEVPDLSSENSDSKQILALVNLANESGGVVIVFTNTSVWNQLQRQGMTIKIDLPNEDEMYSIIKEYIDDYRNEIPIEWDNTDIREAAATLNGVTRIEAENVIAALIANKCIRKSDMDEVRFAKRHFVRICCYLLSWKALRGSYLGYYWWNNRTL